MADIPIGTILILVLLIILSAYFTSSKVAFSNLNKGRMKNYVEENRKGSKKALYILENFDKAQTTLVAGNLALNVTSAIITGKIIFELIGGTVGILTSVAVSTLLIMIFGEIFPTSFAKEYAEFFALKTSGFLLFMMKMFTPITALLIILQNTVSRLLKNDNAERADIEDEIKEMVNMVQDEAILNTEEKELINRTLDFNDIIVGEVLTSRADMTVVDVEMPTDEIRKIFLRERFSRIPVYEESPDNIIGILRERDFLIKLLEQGGEEVDIRPLLRDTVFIAETMRISKLLPELQKSKSQMAMVVDEFGGTAGLITLEDIVEEIVGEIWDEHEEVVNEYMKIDDFTYEFNADIELDNFAELVNIETPKSYYYTLSGWLLEMLEKIPEEQEEVTYKNLTLKITHVEDRRIRSVIAIIHEKERAED